MKFKQIIEFLKSMNKPQRDPKDIRIVIDPGHGGKDWGLRTGKTYNKGYNEILEKNINLEIATRLGWLCSRHEIGFLLTRWGDRYISLSERCKRANLTKARVFLSIHCNYAMNKQVKGVETWFYGGSEQGKAYAKKCQSLLAEIGYTKNRGLRDSKEFYVLKHTKMTSVLLELGFLQNKDDANYLDNENNQMQIATQIFQFIKEVTL